MSDHLADINVGNIEYIRREDAVDAVEFGITLASKINLDTGEWTELFQRENDELREAVKRIKDITPADVVPVVRCGKCRYCTNNWHSSVYDLCKITGRNVIDTDFCNYGKRREE